MMDGAADQGAVAVGTVRINYFYLSEDNEPIGPMSLEVLGQLHGGGVVKDETLVALEGAENWAAYSELGSVQDASKGQHEKVIPVSDVSPGAVEPAPSGEGFAYRMGRVWYQPGTKGRVIRVCGVVLMVVSILMMVHWGRGRGGWSARSPMDPNRVPLGEIADFVESMPKIHTEPPISWGKSDGAMQIFTGENSVLVQKLAAHKDHFQIDVTRYGVVYNIPPEGTRVRDYPTATINFIMGFEGGTWSYKDARGLFSHNLTYPGMAATSITKSEPLSAGGAEWLAEPIVRHLNGGEKARCRVCGEGQPDEKSVLGGFGLGLVLAPLSFGFGFCLISLTVILWTWGVTGVEPLQFLEAKFDRLRWTWGKRSCRGGVSDPRRMSV